MAPTLIGIVAVGILINILQTITQIKDPALAFIPKVIVAAVILLATAAWSMQILNAFCTDMILLAGQGAF
jgi:flagellar biosynthetic protein FliQ